LILFEAARTESSTPGKRRGKSGVEEAEVVMGGIL
jgi:hypothetical protein